MFGGLFVGAVVAVVLRSRWAILLAPIGHIIGFEVARALLFGATGFSSGGIYLGNSVAILVFIASRGVYALLGLLPMVLEAILGAAGIRQVTVGRPVLHGFARIRRYAAHTGTARGRVPWRSIGPRRSRRPGRWSGRYSGSCPDG